MKTITPSATRILAIDAFRGLTIILMILVNNLGSYKHAPTQLLHARWHGCTLTDLVFPFFLFIMGTAMAFSFSKYMNSSNNKMLYLKIVKRTCILFGIGIFAHLVPHFQFDTVRIFGVLQRIALCYLFVSLLVINLNLKVQVILILALLLGYWGIMELVPFPGKGTDSWTFNNNLAQYIDTLVLEKHTWKKGLEPEGIISTIPAVATTLLGYLAGTWLQTENTPQRKNIMLFIGATILLILALTWNIAMPLNKQLWTSSYTLYTAALALYTLAVIYYSIDIKQYSKLFSFAFIFGSNSLAVFVLSSFMAKMLHSVTYSAANGKAVSIKAFIVSSLQNITTLTVGSVLYAIIYILFWFFIALVLYRKKIFVKV